jgi:predicted phosphodiesterase
MRYAIFSDVHNDSSALAAVLRHAGNQQIDRYFCLGDVGIDACVDLVRHVAAPTVFGNWEVSGWRHLSNENRRWALELPPVRREPHFWLTHASPLWPQNLATLADLNANRHQVSLSKLFPYLHYESEALWQAIAALVEAGVRLMFHGHTHRQLGWRFTADNRLQKITRRTVALQPGDTIIVGVGSVGRPLDGPGAAYVIYDDQARQVELLRVGQV